MTETELWRIFTQNMDDIDVSMYLRGRILLTAGQLSEKNFQNLFCDDFILRYTSTYRTCGAARNILRLCAHLFCEHYKYGGAVPLSYFRNVRLCLSISMIVRMQYCAKYAPPALNFFTDEEFCKNRAAINAVVATKDRAITNQLFASLVTSTILGFCDLISATICLQLFKLLYHDICGKDEQLFADMKTYAGWQIAEDKMHFCGNEDAHFDKIYQKAMKIAAKLVQLRLPKKNVN